jgi:hypothetical protein
MRAARFALTSTKGLMLLISINERNCNLFMVVNAAARKS